MRKMQLVGLMIAWVALFSACQAAGRAKDLFTGLVAAQQAVQKVAGSSAVNVNVNNGTYMTISVVNSPARDLPAPAKRAKALEIGTIAYQAYPDRAQLTAVRVVFLISRTYFLLFHVNDGTDAHIFTPEELRTAEPKAAAPKEQVSG